MRTTMTIDDDVLLAAKAMAQRQRTSVGQVITALARQSLCHDHAKVRHVQRQSPAGDAVGAGAGHAGVSQPVARRTAVTTVLLDVAMLIALIDAEHLQHRDAQDRFSRTRLRSLATLDRRLVTDTVRTGAATLHLS